MHQARVTLIARRPMTGDLLGVNEWHGGRYQSLMQVMGLCRSHKVAARRRGCCISLLYHLGPDHPG
jgi:hypothetical protein